MGECGGAWGEYVGGVCVAGRQVWECQKPFYPDGGADPLCPFKAFTRGLYWAGGDVSLSECQAHCDGLDGCRYISWQGARVKQACGADFGSRVGGPCCCGQPGTVGSAKDICPRDTPRCFGYVHGRHMGTCAAAATPPPPPSSANTTARCYLAKVTSSLTPCWLILLCSTTCSFPCCPPFALHSV